MKYATILIETIVTSDSLKRQIVSVGMFEAKDEEEALKQFELDNTAASEFNHPLGNTWLLEADYGDGSVIQLYPITFDQIFHG